MPPGNPAAAHDIEDAGDERASGTTAPRRTRRSASDDLRPPARPRGEGRPPPAAGDRAGGASHRRGSEPSRTRARRRAPARRAHSRSSSFCCWASKRSAQSRRIDRENGTVGDVLPWALGLAAVAAAQLFVAGGAARAPADPRRARQPPRRGAGARRRRGGRARGVRDPGVPQPHPAGSDAAPPAAQPRLRPDRARERGVRDRARSSSRSPRSSRC